MLFAFSANAVLAPFFYFFGGNAAAVFDVILDLAHAQIERVVAADLLAVGLVIGGGGSAIVGLVFVLDVVTALRIHSKAHPSHCQHYESFHVLPCLAHVSRD